MKPIRVITLIAIAGVSIFGNAKSNIRLTDDMLMHESRATVSPADGSLQGSRFVSFQWPLPAEFQAIGAPLDGLEADQNKPDKTKLRYKIRFSNDKNMKKGVREYTTLYPFYNAHEITKAGKYYWQYADCSDGKETWSPVYTFTYKDSDTRFSPPSAKEFMADIPSSHPRILTTPEARESLVASSMSKPERKWYIAEAEKVMAKPMGDINNIPLDQLDKLTNVVMRNSWMTRESRRIIDAEEQNVEMLTRTFVLTGEDKYAREAIHRVLAMISWADNEYVKGDFNDATFLSVTSLAYDTFYDRLSSSQRQKMLSLIDEKLGHMYDHYNNYLENHLAENHIWQMTLRIAMNAGIASYGDLPSTADRLEYLYNAWIARFPGLNDDGAWHNGDSYYTVNTRTLIELPFLMRRITGFDYFSDLWYDNNVLYAIYQQPPFSKSGGNGSSHLKRWRPLPARVAMLDALARIKHNSYAADYVRTVLAQDPNCLKKNIKGKASSLAWVSIQLDDTLPGGPGLAQMPHGHVFPQSGLASNATSLGDIPNNAMWTFRSSPYGSTSHALANQNSFNTFFGGDPLFYSSGHHIEFTDKHSMLSHRATRAHNTILVDGMGQQLGTEGYGWMPRHYDGNEISYVVGDASNAYGPVVSSLWLDRGRLSEVEYTPATGWDENKLVKYRRHMVTLGNEGLLMIYDELEADRPVEWSYMLHSVMKPLELSNVDGGVHVTARNHFGASDAFVYSSGKLDADTTSKFFQPAVNWLLADDKGNFHDLPNHWHFTAKSEKNQKYYFVTFVDTHSNNTKAVVPVMRGNGNFVVGDWAVTVNLDTTSTPAFSAKNSKGDEVIYKGEETKISDGGKKHILKDKRPELEI